jgi:hypothetical protein
MSVLLTAAVAAVGLTPGASSAGAAPAAPNAVIVWNANAGQAALAACIAPLDDPLHESRMYAMVHLAIHDALNAIDRRSRPYAYHGRAHGPTSSGAAVAAAAHDVLVAAVGAIPAPFSQACRDAGTASVEANYATALAAIPAGSAKTRGLTLGQAAAAAILAVRAGDGSDTPLIDPNYPQGTTPGVYRFTPGTPFAFAPGWGQVTPFTLTAADQFRPGPPPGLNTPRYTRDFLEVTRLGGDGVTTATERTAEQTQIALFWWESSPLAWNRLTRGIAATRHLDLWQSARLFGLLNMAMADGYVATFDTKYHDNYWRPVTAIQAAESDGNPDTPADPTWTPLRTTPAIPEYDSGHAVQGGAAAAVLRGFFGTDRIAFINCSRTLPAGDTCTDPTPVIRHYTRLSQAAAENAISRILIGFHFRTAVQVGTRHGDRIGSNAVDHYLQPTS